MDGVDIKMKHLNNLDDDFLNDVFLLDMYLIKASKLQETLRQHLSIVVNYDNN